MLVVANQYHKFEIVEIEVEGGVDLGFGIKDSTFQCGVIGEVFYVIV